MASVEEGSAIGSKDDPDISSKVLTVMKK